MQSLCRGQRSTLGEGREWMSAIPGGMAKEAAQPCTIGPPPDRKRIPQLSAKFARAPRARGSPLCQGAGAGPNAPPGRPRVDARKTRTRISGATCHDHQDGRAAAAPIRRGNAPVARVERVAVFSLL
jgi:hypothetical protein